MVVFSCDGCGEVLKKNQVDAHAGRCRSCASVSCADCAVSFYGGRYAGVGGAALFYGICDFDWRCCFRVVPIWGYENLFQQQQQQTLGSIINMTHIYTYLDCQLRYSYKWCCCGCCCCYVSATREDQYPPTENVKLQKTTASRFQMITKLLF